MTNPRLGRLLVLEGIDGSGKTTQAFMLKDWFADNGYPAELYREPGGTSLGEQIRSILLAAKEYNPPISPEAEFLLFAAARREICLQVIRPALEAGNIVVLDRFADSSLAYQGFGRGVNLEFIKDTNRSLTDGLRPDLTILLDLDPIIAQRRRGSGQDRMESSGLDFFQRVREGYWEIAKRNKNTWIKIDGSPDAAIIHNQIIQVIKRLFEKC